MVHQLYLSLHPSVVASTLVSTGSVVTSTSPVIDLTNLQDNSVRYGKDFWVKIGSISLSE